MLTFAYKDDEYLKKAAGFGSGIRILKFNENLFYPRDIPSN